MATTTKTSSTSSSATKAQVQAQAQAQANSAANTKKHLSLFSFMSASSSESKDNSESVNPTDPLPALSTSPTNGSGSGSGSGQSQSQSTALSASSSQGGAHFETFPTLTEDQELHPSLIDNPECCIFERSVQDSCCVFEPAPLNRQHSNSIISTNSKSGKKPRSYNSSISLNHFKSEDYIPPALDATTSLLNDKNTDLDDVELIYSNRRNSSVIGLNMALGRPISPSRKNSVYSLNSASNGNLPPLQTDQFNNSTTSPPGPHQIHSPVSPPKLTPSKSSVNFYSYADMLSNDEFARRPSIKSSLSQGVVPTSNTNFTRNPSFIKHRNPSTSSQLSSQLFKEKKASQQLRSQSMKSNSTNPTNNITSSLNKFLISPESSDEENDYRDKLLPPQAPATSTTTNSVASSQSPRYKRKSVSSTTSSNHSYSAPMFNDNESLISTSIGDCIRQSTTEINGH
ncbi:beta-1,6-N-acetylglucosaminyltransferase [Scheffersomyces amazonensis]|uniref:beta-1,6-N-acetylglucosaminyltransferase n=1 Tax=Scheffersomyces amazonensis TaxID=1078765 RepID=UPI00315D3AB9